MNPSIEVVTYLVVYIPSSSFIAVIDLISSLCILSILFSLNPDVNSLNTEGLISSGLSCLADPNDYLVEAESSSILFSYLLSSLDNVSVDAEVLPLLVLFGTGPPTNELGI